MYRLIAIVAFLALLIGTTPDAKAEDSRIRLGSYGYSPQLSFGSSYRHNSYHDSLGHNGYHRVQGHRDAHRYPMTWSGHGRVHDSLNHGAYHDQVDHRAKHRGGAFYPSWSLGISGRRYSIRLGW